MIALNVSLNRVMGSSRPIMLFTCCAGVHRLVDRLGGCGRHGGIIARLAGGPLVAFVLVLLLLLRGLAFLRIDVLARLGR